MAKAKPTILNADYSTFIGTPPQLRAMLAALFASAAVVNASYCNWVVLDRPLAARDIDAALTTTPRKQKG